MGLQAPANRVCPHRVEQTFLPSRSCKCRFLRGVAHSTLAQRPGIFRNEDLSDHEVMLELARCDANEELAGALQRYEEDDSVFWDERRREKNKRLADPDDVFFAARDRKQEIKEQMKQLERGLARQHPKRQPHGKKRRRPKKKQPSS